MKQITMKKKVKQLCCIFAGSNSLHGDDSSRYGCIIQIL